MSCGQCVECEKCFTCQVQCGRCYECQQCFTCQVGVVPGQKPKQEFRVQLPRQPAQPRQAPIDKQRLKELILDVLIELGLIGRPKTKREVKLE